MRVFTAILFVLLLWTSVAQAQETRVEWLNPSIDCTSDRYPTYVNPFDVYEQFTDVLVRRRPDGVLFFSVNIIFGYCSPSERAFIPQEGRNITVVSIDKLPWKKIPWLVDAKAYLRTNIQGFTYNTLEIRVDEQKLLAALSVKKQAALKVGYHDFNLSGARVKWIFENTTAGLKARIQEIR
jgi:hypothetical protein